MPVQFLRLSNYHKRLGYTPILQRSRWLSLVRVDELAPRLVIILSIFNRRPSHRRSFGFMNSYWGATAVPETYVCFRHRVISDRAYCMRILCAIAELFSQRAAVKSPEVETLRRCWLAGLRGYECTSMQFYHACG